jgi:hypothetical protein
MLAASRRHSSGLSAMPFLPGAMLPSACTHAGASHACGCVQAVHIRRGACPHAARALPCPAGRGQASGFQAESLTHSEEVWNTLKHSCARGMRRKVSCGSLPPSHRPVELPQVH